MVSTVVVCYRDAGFNGSSDGTVISSSFRIASTTSVRPHAHCATRWVSGISIWRPHTQVTQRTDVNLM